LPPSAKKSRGHFGPVGSIHVFIAIPSILPSNAFANDFKFDISLQQFAQLFKNALLLIIQRLTYPPSAHTRAGDVQNMVYSRYQFKCAVQIKKDRIEYK